MAGERPLREGAYSGGSQMAVPFPGDQGDDDNHADHDPDDDQGADDNDEGDEGDGDEGGDGGRRSVSLPGGGLAGAGAGWVLGVLLWGWVVLPFVKGGPVQVKNTLRAKFLNQAADGSRLP